MLKAWSVSHVGFSGPMLILAALHEFIQWSGRWGRRVAAPV